MNAYRNASYVGFVIMIFGAIITVYGFSFLLNQQELEANAVRVKGTVIELSSNGPMYLAPVVKFKTNEGREITFRSELDLNKSLNPYSVGQEVNVIYHKDNPTKAKIDAFWEANFGQIFLGIFGLIVMLVGLIIRWSLMRKSRR